MQITKDVTVTVSKKETIAVECDVCKKMFDQDDVLDLQEMTHIRFRGGYGSIFGDGDMLECDICQHCLKERLGDALRIIPEEELEL